MMGIESVEKHKRIRNIVFEIRVSIVVCKMSGYIKNENKRKRQKKILIA